MDSITWGFFLTVIIDFIVMIVLIILFFALKKYRCNPNLKDRYNIYLNESSLSFRDLAKSVYSHTLLNIKIFCNDESHHYLYLVKILAYLVSIQSIYSIIVLLPIYSVGDNDSYSMFYLSYGNIIYNQYLLIAPFIIFVLNSILCYYILKLYVQESQKSLVSSTTNHFAVRILKLPDNMPQNELARKVAEQLEVNIDRVYAVPNLQKAFEYKKRLKEAEDELLHLHDVEKLENKRPMFREKLLWGENIDAISHQESKINILKGKLEREYLYTKTSNSGVCIVRTNGRASKTEISESIRKRFPGTIVTSVVTPDDVKWENIDIDANSAKCSRIFLTIIFFIIFVIFLTPTTFIYFVDNILSGIGLGPIFLGFLGLYVPGILLVVYQLVLVPYTVRFLVKRERHHSKSKEVTSAIRKYLLFFMFNILFVPAIGMQSYRIVEMALESKSFDTWSKEIAMKINDTSVWFMAYLFTQMLVVNAIELIQPGILIEVKFRALRAISPREIYNAYLPEPIEFAYEYAVLLTFFTIILIYSISYPLILVVGSGYLWIRFFVQKYNIMCIYSTESIPSTISNIAVKTFAISILLFQWVTCFLFILSNILVYMILGFFMLASSAITIMVFWIKYKSIFKLLLGVQSQHLINSPYKHPLEL